MKLKKANEIAEDTQSNYQQLSKSMDTILNKYRDDESEETDADFNRAFRFATAVRIYPSCTKRHNPNRSGRFK